MAKIELRGNIDLRKALRSFTPDLEKQLRKDLAAALKPIVAKARGFVPSDSPMSGWASRSFSEGKFPTYNASTIRSGITYSTSPSQVNKYGFSSMARITNKSAAGAIYEIAGRKGPQVWVGPKGGDSKGFSRSVNPQAGEQFLENLPALSSSLKGRGRLIFKAWAQDAAKADTAALQAIDEASQLFNAKVAAGPLSRAA
jgi:hypothetical protein